MILVTGVATEMTSFEAVGFQASGFSQSDPPAPPVRTMSVREDSNALFSSDTQSLAIFANEIRHRALGGAKETSGPY